MLELVLSSMNMNYKPEPDSSKDKKNLTVIQITLEIVFY